MPTSKKQMVKLNQVKKAKAEELSKQAAAGSQEAKKKLKKLEKKLKWASENFQLFFNSPLNCSGGFAVDQGLLWVIPRYECSKMS